MIARQVAENLWIVPGHTGVLLAQRPGLQGVGPTEEAALLAAEANRSYSETLPMRGAKDWGWIRD